MKTGHQLILKLSNGARKKFIQNVTRIHGVDKAKNILERKYQHVHSVLNGSFAWKDSKEGQEYWIKAYQNAV